jgi:hypothetical protein
LKLVGEGLNQLLIETTSEALTVHLAAGLASSPYELKEIEEDIDTLSDISEDQLPLAISVEATTRVIYGLKEIARDKLDGRHRTAGSFAAIITLSELGLREY